MKGACHLKVAPAVHSLKQELSSTGQFSEELSMVLKQ